MVAGKNLLFSAMIYILLAFSIKNICFPCNKVIYKAKSVEEKTFNSKHLFDAGCQAMSVETKSLTRCINKYNVKLRIL